MEQIIPVLARCLKKVENVHLAKIVCPSTLLALSTPIIDAYDKLNKAVSWYEKASGGSKSKGTKRKAHLI